MKTLLPKYDYPPSPHKRERLIIHYGGLYDFDGLYALVISWAKSQGYIWCETDYKHKVPSPKGAEQEFWWVLRNKVTDYMELEIKLTLHLWDVLEVEVNVDGKKKTLTSGKLYIWIDTALYYDWQKRFKGSRWYRTLGLWYAALVARKKMDNLYFEHVFYRAYDLHALIKKFFDMQAKYYAYEDYLKET